MWPEGTVVVSSPSGAIYHRFIETSPSWDWEVVKFDHPGGQCLGVYCNAPDALLCYRKEVETWEAQERRHASERQQMQTR